MSKKDGKGSIRERKVLKISEMDNTPEEKLSYALKNNRKVMLLLTLYYIIVSFTVSALIVTNVIQFWVLIILLPVFGISLKICMNIFYVDTSLLHLVLWATSTKE